MIFNYFKAYNGLVFSEKIFDKPILKIDKKSKAKIKKTKKSKFPLKKSIK